MKNGLILYLSFLFGLSATQAETILIKNARILTGDERGTIEAADVLIDGPTITAVGQALVVPENTREIDASGHWLSPGLFNADTQIGVREVSAIDATVDGVTKDSRFTAAFFPIDAYNSDSVLIPHNRSLGLTHVLVVPHNEANLFAGMSSIINLSQGESYLEKRDAAVVFEYGEEGAEIASGSRAIAIARLRAALDDARDYSENRAAYNAGNRREYGLSHHDLEVVAKVVARETPLLVRVRSVSDIRTLLKLGAAENIDLILADAQDAWRVADEIAQAGVPVIIDPIFNVPSAYESLHPRLDSAAILHEAGVTLLFTGMSWHRTHNAYLVRQSAANAVANGLAYDAALAAMTSNPAKVFQLRSSGSIAEGHRANLVLWTGDPLEMTSGVVSSWIDGVEFAPYSRSDALRDRYWQRMRTKNTVDKPN